MELYRTAGSRSTSCAKKSQKSKPSSRILDHTHMHFLTAQNIICEFGKQDIQELQRFDVAKRGWNRATERILLKFQFLKVNQIAQRRWYSPGQLILIQPPAEHQRNQQVSKQIGVRYYCKICIQISQGADGANCSRYRSTKLVFIKIQADKFSQVTQCCWYYTAQAVVIQLAAKIGKPISENRSDF